MRRDRGESLSQRGFHHDLQAISGVEYGLVLASRPTVFASLREIRCNCNNRYVIRLSLPLI